MNLRQLFIIPFISIALSALACTSAIVAPRATRNGNILLWKHRDTSNSNNYVDTVRSENRAFDYIALFNSSDSLKREAWAGANRSGFAIFNTVAGNLPKNKKGCADREGMIMSLALSKCVTVADFERLLDSLPKPLGVRTNFGVADAEGNMAYFETDDYRHRKFPMDTAEQDLMIRSNYAFSGTKKGGYGFERYAVASAVLAPHIAEKSVQPETFTELLSRCYLDSVKGDVLNGKSGTIADKNFIPRPTSASSVVIELTPDGPIMWTMLGYPPASYAIGATIDNISPDLKRDPQNGRNAIADEANARKKSIISNDNINVRIAKQIISEMSQRSLDNYESFRKNSPFD